MHLPLKQGIAGSYPASGTSQSVRVRIPPLGNERGVIGSMPANASVMARPSIDIMPLYVILTPVDQWTDPKSSKLEV